MQFPVLVTLPNGDLINVNQITRVKQMGVHCYVYFAQSTASFTTTGKWRMGGEGEMYTNGGAALEYVQLDMTAAEFLALINKELALVHAMGG